MVERSNTIFEEANTTTSWKTKLAHRLELNLISKWIRGGERRPAAAE